MTREAKGWSRVVGPPPASLPKLCARIRARFGGRWMRATHASAIVAKLLTAITTSILDLVRRDNETKDDDTGELECPGNTECYPSGAAGDHRCYEVLVGGSKRTEHKWRDGSNDPH